MTAKALWLGGITLLAVACGPEVQRVAIPAPDDRNAYQPVPYSKPLPPEATGQPMAPPPPQVQQAPQPQPQPQGAPQGPQAPQPPQAPMPPQAPQPPAQQVPMGPPVINHVAQPGEAEFVRAYQTRRMPRIMVFVNRSIQGDVTVRGSLKETVKVEERHVATGALKIADEKTLRGNANTNVQAADYFGTAQGNRNVATEDTKKSSFETGGPAEYSHSTSVQVTPGQYDQIGASREDYEAIELSTIDFMNCAGQVDIKDSEMLRAKMDRETVLRLENGDRAVLPLLQRELQTDILMQIKATPTSHATAGPAVRLLAKVMSTTDGRILASTYVDMPLPMTKTNINVFTRYLAVQTMTKLANVWGNGYQPVWDPLEIRIYKAAGVDDVLKIRRFVQQTRGVRNVTSRGATGSSQTGYGTLAVVFDGAPEDFYAELKEAIGTSSGLKAVDLQANTISLEVTGPMNLVTTSTKTEVRTETKVETKTTETQKVDPILPAPPQEPTSAPAH